VGRPFEIGLVVERAQAVDPLPEVAVGRDDGEGGGCGVQVQGE
jgi:hypothetical protein